MLPQMSPPLSEVNGSRFPRALLFVTIVLCVVLIPLAGVVQIFAQTTPSAKRSLTLPISKFYDTPNPLPAGKPGELIRATAADDYYLAADFSAFRILYHSRSATGKDVAVSGVVLVPAGKPPAGGWPVIAWAHAFTGAGRQCAPSLWKNLYYGPFLSMYLNLGYAVVATDCAGLGTDFRSAVMDVESNATDVINSIPAARAAAPQLGSRWVAMGPSLGANVTIGVAELEGRIRDPNYLGGVAISGVADLKDSFEHLPKEQSLRMLAFLAYGIKTAYPDFDVRDMLTEKALPAYHQINESCGSVGNNSELSTSEMLKQNWNSNKFVGQFLERNQLGRNPAYGPLLVITDDADSAVPLWMTARVIARMCKQGNHIQVDRFSGLEPGRVIGGSVRDQMTWIEARFAGRPAPNNCP
jgi:hypothetical protein